MLSRRLPRLGFNGASFGHHSPIQSRQHAASDKNITLRLDLVRCRASTAPGGNNRSFQHPTPEDSDAGTDGLQHLESRLSSGAESRGKPARTPRTSPTPAKQGKLDSLFEQARKLDQRDERKMDWSFLDRAPPAESNDGARPVKIGRWGFQFTPRGFAERRKVDAKRHHESLQQKSLARVGLSAVSQLHAASGMADKQVKSELHSGGTVFGVNQSHSMLKEQPSDFGLWKEGAWEKLIHGILGEVLGTMSRHLRRPKVVRESLGALPVENEAQRANGNPTARPQAKMRALEGGSECLRASQPTNTGSVIGTTLSEAAPGWRWREDSYQTPSLAKSPPLDRTVPGHVHIRVPAHGAPRAGANGKELQQEDNGRAFCVDQTTGEATGKKTVGSAIVSSDLSMLETRRNASLGKRSGFASGESMARLEECAQPARASTEMSRPKKRDSVLKKTSSPPLPPILENLSKRAPAKNLMDLVDMGKRGYQDLTPVDIDRAVKLMAGIRQPRLPELVTMLVLMDVGNEVGVNSASQREKLYSTALRLGHSAEDINLWKSIATTSNSEDAVLKFVASGHQHPIFLLNHVLRPTAEFPRKESLEKLLRYMSQWYSNDEITMSETVKERREKAGGDEDDEVVYDRRQINLRQLTPAAFDVTIRRLAVHCCRYWPELLPTVGHVAASIIKNFIPRVVSQNKVFPAQNRAFNTYLQALAQAPDRMGRRYMQHVWEAQRILLAMSGGLEKPLMVEHMSFRAVRVALVGLKKTEAEQDAAATLSNTWPPYRVDRFGLDQQRNPDDDLTRPVKAGIAMQEAGYAKDAVDDMIDTLAGMAPDGTPTIQTRANLQGLLGKRDKAVGPQVMWATAIRATRNGQEAWAMFSHPPVECKPDHRVYAELLSKLFARPARADWYRAGDGRHTVQVHIPNLSDFEKARIQPPTPEEVCRMMQHDGVNLEGHLLTIMLRNTESIDAANAHLRSSTLDADVAEFLIHGQGEMKDVFKRMPFGPLYEYVSLLLRLHPRASAARPHEDVRSFMSRAMDLVIEYTEVARSQTQPVSLRGLWMLLAIRWSGSRGVWLPYRDEPIPAFQQLFWHLRIAVHARAISALDGDMFYYAARGVCSKVVQYLEILEMRLDLRPDDLSVFASDPVTTFTKPCATVDEEIEGSSKDASSSAVGTVDDVDALEGRYLKGDITPLDVIIAASKLLANDFDLMTKTLRPPENPDQDLPLPKTYGTFRATEAHIYMQTLAVLGDFPRAIRLLEWCAERYEEEGSVMDQKQRFHFWRTFCAFRTLAEGNVHVEEERIAGVIERLTKARAWPGKEELGEYVNGGELTRVIRGRLQKLRPDVYNLDI